MSSCRLHQTAVPSGTRAFRGVFTVPGRVGSELEWKTPSGERSCMEAFNGAPEARATGSATDVQDGSSRDVQGDACSCCNKAIYLKQTSRQTKERQTNNEERNRKVDMGRAKQGQGFGWICFKAAPNSVCPPVRSCGRQAVIFLLNVDNRAGVRASADAHFRLSGGQKEAAVSTHYSQQIDLQHEGHEGNLLCLANQKKALLPCGISLTITVRPKPTRLDATSCIRRTWDHGHSRVVKQ